MAKFKGNGLVWDKDNDCVLCKFINGEYYTTDEREKEILRNIGFKYDDEDEIPIIEDDAEEENEEYIRQLAKEQGIKSWHVKSIDNLKKELSEME